MTSKASFQLVADKHFKEDLEHWSRTDQKVAGKILKLAEAIQADPFKGIGKPEPLKSLGAWSRRIMQEHRLVYRVDQGKVYLLQCRYHYGK
jgi:toxin YoeB